MKILDLNGYSSDRKVLDKAIKELIKDSLASEKVSVNEVIHVLTHMLPEFCNRNFLEGHLVGAYSTKVTPIICPHIYGTRKV